uniref:MORN repeat-containing protein 3 n=1 Tax=Gouania willdenowi TaxID=441366 RepID=A0A8C5EMR6_GOUWI
MAFHKPKKRALTTAEREAKTMITGKRACVFSPNGDVYKGEWLNNLKHGKGIEFKNIAGSKFQGQWKLGKRDGYGVSSEWNCELNQFEKSFIGYWKNGKKHGFGTMFYKNLGVYEGEWCQGVKEGFGIMYYENGDIYEGYWRRDMAHGLGILRLVNGNKYEGSFEDGIANGKGVFYYFHLGKIYEGLWKKGSPVCGTISDSEREEAATPSTYSITTIRLVDANGVLNEAEKEGGRFPP